MSSKRGASTPNRNPHGQGYDDHGNPYPHDMGDQMTDPTPEKPKPETVQRMVDALSVDMPQSWTRPVKAARVADAMVETERERWMDLVDTMIAAGVDVSATREIVTLNGVNLIADTVLNADQSALILAALRSSVSPPTDDEEPQPGDVFDLNGALFTQEPPSVSPPTEREKP